MIYAYFLGPDDLTGEDNWEILAWGLGLTGLAGAALLNINPRWEVKVAGQRSAWGVLAGYALLAAIGGAFELGAPWLLVFLTAVVGGIAFLWWRSPPICPHCGEPETFGPDGSANVCTNCGFDYRSDDY